MEKQICLVGSVLFVALVGCSNAPAASHDALLGDYSGDTVLDLSFPDVPEAGRYQHINQPDISVEMIGDEMVLRSFACEMVISMTDDQTGTLSAETCQAFHNGRVVWSLSVSLMDGTFASFDDGSSFEANAIVSGDLTVFEYADDGSVSFTDTFPANVEFSISAHR